MATSTFNKSIVLDQEAAEILAKELNNDISVKLPDEQYCKPPITKEELKTWLKSANLKQ